MLQRHKQSATSQHRQVARRRLASERLPFALWDEAEGLPQQGISQVVPRVILQPAYPNAAI